MKFVRLIAAALAVFSFGACGASPLDSDEMEMATPVVPEEETQTQEQAVCGTFWSPSCIERNHSKTCGLAVREYDFADEDFVWNGAGYTRYLRFHVRHCTAAGGPGYHCHPVPIVSRRC